jgi:hypothetical protein
MHTTTSEADLNFILQQGLDAPESKSRIRVASALLFQPRLVGLISLAGAISQSPAAFAALGALLWWSALLPRLNPFDFGYNRTLGRSTGAPALGPAPMPRRFAQAIAGTFATASAATMASGFWIAAWAPQTALLLAVAALVFGKFCLGSFVYHLARGRVTFAIGTLPWRQGACRA